MDMVKKLFAMLKRRYSKIEADMKRQYEEGKITWYACPNSDDEAINREIAQTIENNRENVEKHGVVWAWIYSYYISAYSDMYKSAYNCRPYSYDFDISKGGIAALLPVARAYRDACKAAHRTALMKKAEQDQAVKEFEAEIQTMMDHGATSLKQALEWILQSQKIDFESELDVESFVWEQGISYTKLSEKIYPILKDMVKRAA